MSEFRNSLPAGPFQETRERHPAQSKTAGEKLESRPEGMTL